MIPGSTDNGRTDTEYTPTLTKVTPPLGDVVAAHEATIKRLENTVAVQGEEIAQLRAQNGALVRRIYALEQHAVNGLEQHTGIGYE